MAKVEPQSWSAAASPRERAAGLTRFKVTETLLPYLFLLPVVALMLIFIYWPLIYSVYLSFFDWNFVSPDKTWVGFDNYTRLVNNSRFEQSVRQTGVYIIALVPLQVFLPLGLALLLWPIRKARTQSAYRIMLFSPTVVAYSVGALLWLWIFNPLMGVLNQVIVNFGGERVNWLSNPRTAIWCVIIVAAWKSLGFNLLLYLAALEAVPTDYIEAAQVDGASSWQIIRSIRWPLITPTFFFVLVTTIIAVNDEVFGAINVLTDGGPYNKTSNIVYYLYQQGFRFFQIGTASAVSLIIFVGTVLLTWLQFRFVERHVHYG
jgi:sn-glycerol 3-phosphate transport system permease protein